MSTRIKEIDEKIKALQKEKKKLIQKDIPDAFIGTTEKGRGVTKSQASINLCEMRFGERVTNDRCGVKGGKKYHTLSRFYADGAEKLPMIKSEIERIKNLLDAAYREIESEELGD